ncbi:glycoside hydrolase family 75 protein [Streptomyces sp. YKOK-I1]
MRAQSLTLAAAGLVLLAPTTGSVAARHDRGSPGAPGIRHEGAVRAADLLARVRDCAPVSRGRYRTDDGTPATVPVCGAREAVYWTADMDIDCDGRPGAHCNSGTDPLFSDATAFPQSDGRYLSAETLPYIVVPEASDLWNPRDHGVGGGAVAAVVYRDRVQYAVVGDVGPPDIIGEASYATAAALGIRPDPHGGGAPSGVTYIVFRNSRATPIESHESAVEVGERLARSFVRSADRAAQGPGAAGGGAADRPPGAPAGRGSAARTDQRSEADPDARAAGEATSEEPDGRGAEEAEGDEGTEESPEATDAGTDEEADEATGAEAGEE